MTPFLPITSHQHPISLPPTFLQPHLPSKATLNFLISSHQPVILLQTNCFPFDPKYFSKIFTPTIKNNCYVFFSSYFDIHVANFHIIIFFLKKELSYYFLLMYLFFILIYLFIILCCKLS